MISLFDVDSLIYKAIYKVVSRDELREQLSKIDPKKNRKKQKAAIREWIVESSFNKLEQMAYRILNDTEENYGMRFDKVEFYVTYCLASERKKIDPSYKAKRQFNKWASKLRAYIVEQSNLDCRYSLRWEADDLIADRAKALRKENVDYCVFSIDKDLIQIPGIHFNYYMEKVKGEYKATIPLSEYKANYRELNQMFFIEKTKLEAKIYSCVLQYKGLRNVEPRESANFLLEQMIIGDGCDNVKGLPGKGFVFTKKLFGDHPVDNAKKVINAYKEHYGENNYKRPMKIAFRLLKIGI